MIVIRLSKRKYHPLDGKGASIAGGRWNSRGKSVVYTSSCSALAVVEYLAHLDLSMIPSGLLIALIEIPNTLPMERVHSVPADESAFKNIGDSWLESNATAVLEVPSILVPRQKNYLLNPVHPLFAVIKVLESNPFAFDSRLLSS
jgi:RES domain-containing protein